MVMRVIIFDISVNILRKFSCSRYLEFSNGVCTNDKNEILISDNRAHCIKVFSYDGQSLRQVGGEGISNYPIGVAINAMGDVVVADNHNNFSLNVFSQDGAMTGALERRWCTKAALFWHQKTIASICIISNAVLVVISSRPISWFTIIWTVVDAGVRLFILHHHLSHMHTFVNVVL